MPESPLPRVFALSLADAAQSIARRIDSSLAAIRGISYAEYRLLATLASAPGARATRVNLASALGLTPSGITRALRPLEKLGIVATVKSKRDARLAIAALTAAGRELLNDASSVVDDTMQALADRVDTAQLEASATVLRKLTR